MPGTGRPTDAAPPDAPGWMLRHRVAVPELPVRYCDRPALTVRCTPTARRVTVLAAPGGFGKTTLLAAACRAEAARGVPVAWLTLADAESAATLDAYLAFAFHHARIDLPATAGAGEVPPDSPHPRTAMLLRALEERRAPCVLVLDELERVADPESVALLGFLLAAAPPCLHLALAFRRLPHRLDALKAVLDTDAGILATDDLRFSTPDIARFFDLALSRRELAEVAAASRGWPIALRISANRPGHPLRENARVTRDVVGNWLAGRFWRGFEDRDRELVLDAGLFDWFDEALFDDVVRVPGALRRLAALTGLAGLLEPPGAATRGVYRLHPLLHEHCAAERRDRTPGRYRATHRRIALALARRSDVVAAMRHATEAGDPPLAGRILLEAGALRWWLRESAERLLAADRYLTDAVVAGEPRLAMARCVALALTDRLREARATFRAAATGGGADLAVDHLCARSVLALHGCEAVQSAEARNTVADLRRLANLPTVPASMRAVIESGLAVYYNLRGDFDAVAACCRSARRLAGRRIAMTADIQLGQVAMARGHVREAMRRYGSARRAARTRFLGNLVLAAYADVLHRELALERNRLPSGGDGVRHLLREARRSGAHFAHYAAASGTAIELILESDGTDAALFAIDTMLEHATRAALPTLERYLAALRVSLLADAGRVAEAERTWRAAALPARDADCLDPENQGWREMEAVVCARLRLLRARGDVAAGRSLGAALVRSAAARGLRRTEMRALALLVRLEHNAGARGAATKNLTEYLRLYARTDYARPLVRIGTAGTTALRRFLQDSPDPALASAAEGLLIVGASGRATAAPAFASTQRAVLQYLATHQDKQIAAALGLSTHGVRYHVRAIFRKLGANGRADAVRRARALGILPADPR